MILTSVVNSMVMAFAGDAIPETLPVKMDEVRVATEHWWAGFILYQHYKTYVKLRHWHISCYSSVNKWQAKYLTDSRGISADAYLNPPDAAIPASARGPAAARPAAARKLGLAAMAAQWIQPDKFLDREGEEVAKFKEREQVRRRLGRIPHSPLATAPRAPSLTPRSTPLQHRRSPHVSSRGSP